MKKRAEIVALARAEGGIPIWGCLPGSPAARAGLQYGDILISVDGHLVTSIGEFLELRAASAGPLTLVVRREAELLTFVVDVTPTELSPTDVDRLASELVASDILHATGDHDLDIN